MDNIASDEYGKKLIDQYKKGIDHCKQDILKIIDKEIDEMDNGQNVRFSDELNSIECGIKRVAEIVKIRMNLLKNEIEEKI